MKFADAMRMYGSDKPDLRIESKIEDVAGSASSFKFLKKLAISRSVDKKVLADILSANKHSF